MKILSTLEYNTLCRERAEALKERDSLREKVAAEDLRQFQAGVVAGRADTQRTEREEFITNLRATFLDQPLAVTADLLKEYDCKVAPPNSNPFASKGSLSAQLAAQPGASRQWPF